MQLTQDRCTRTTKDACEQGPFFEVMHKESNFLKNGPLEDMLLKQNAHNDVAHLRNVVVLARELANVSVTCWTATHNPLARSIQNSQ